MKQKSIVYNNYLERHLVSLGFKRKGGDGFIREFNGVQQIINFLYSNQNEHFVRYYNIYVGVSYPKVIEIGRQLECYTVGTIGTTIGYLTHEKTYKTWKVTDVISDNDLERIVDDMYKCIIDFAIPYLEKYSVISNIINDMEGGLLINQADELHNLPIYYYLEGEKSHALNYMSHRLKSMELKTLKYRSDESFICNVYDKQPIVDNRHYRQYQHFCESFISYMEDGHCDYGVYNKTGDGSE